VDDGTPTPRTTALLVLVDAMGDAQRRAISSWVDGGGTLVLADRDSPLNPFRTERATFLGLVERDLPRRCAVPALQSAGHVLAPEAALLRVRPPAVGCFTTGHGAWLVTQSQGRGNLVVVGGADPFTNGSLRDADNGLLAVTLLAPSRAPPSGVSSSGPTRAAGRPTWCATVLGGRRRGASVCRPTPPSTLWPKRPPPAPVARPTTSTLCWPAPPRPTSGRWSPSPRM